MKANQVNSTIMQGMKTNRFVCVIDTRNERELS